MSCAEAEALDKAKLVRQWNAIRKRARKESGALFTACIKDERRRQPVILAPHQRLGLEFMDYHKRGVMIWPINHSKTTNGIAWALRKILDNPSSRGAIISATQAQASKILRVIKAYIEEDDEFKSLATDPETGEVRVRRGEKWTDSLIIVDRPPGIKDPTVVAVGIDGGLPGARLDWVLVDDLLNFENTRTKDQRDKIFTWFDSTAISRLEPDGQLMVMNSAWHPDDVLHRLEKLGWATLRMQVTGDIYLKDDVDMLAAGKMWDSDLFVEVPGGDAALGVRFRIKPDVVKEYQKFMKFRFGLEPSNDNMLWDPHPTIKSIDELKRKHQIAAEFNRLYMSHTRDDGSAMCKMEWIEHSKRNARERGIYKLPKRVTDGNRVFTGVDLAISKKDGSDDTAFFTIEILPSGHRLIIDIEIGKLHGPEIKRELVRAHKDYQGVFRVENNACFVPGSLVLTRDRGYAAIETIEQGEYVWTHRGRWRRVIERIDGESRTLVEFRAKGNVSVRCTPNHWFYLRRSGRTPGRKGGHYRPMGDAKWISGGFVDESAYAALARPVWDRSEPVVHLEETNKNRACVIDVKEDLAFVMGLFMAEGNSATGQVAWTFSTKEMYLAEHAQTVLARYFPKMKVSIALRESTIRVTANGRQVRELFAMGKSVSKAPPTESYGWPLHLRLMMVRGWFVGDGCLRVNNQASRTPRPYLSGQSISRNMMLFIRSTLLEAGYRATLKNIPARENEIDGRAIRGKSSYGLSLAHEDSCRLLKDMNEVEMIRWGKQFNHTRRSNVSIVVDDTAHAWSKVVQGPFEFQAYDGQVHNLVVEEDHSYTVEDYVVHNAQDFVLQFVREDHPDVPVRGHTTGANKAREDFGVPSIFTEMANGAWIIPSAKDGTCEPNVQRFIDECLYYSPSRHTGDALMACYFAREQAREFGVLSGGDTAILSQQSANTQSIGAMVMTR